MYMINGCYQFVNEMHMANSYHQGVNEMHMANGYRSGTVNSKSFVSKVFL